MVISVKYKPMSFMGLYTSICIFFFSACLIAIPNGYSYAPLLLLLASVVLIIRRPKLNLQTHDWLFIAALFLYFVVNVASVLVHSLPIKSYDLPSRYLLAIPVYLLLIAYPAHKNYFWVGLIVGVIGACCVAIYQRYFLAGVWWRVGGFINPIQFGDICILMASFLMCGLLTCFNSSDKPNKYVVLIMVLSVGMALFASFLSWSRGGWLAIPLIILVFYKAIPSSLKRKVLLFFLFLGVFGFVTFILLPQTNSVKERVLQGINDVRIYSAGDQTPTSVNTRVNMWVNGIKAFKDRPLIGWGDLSPIKLNYAPDWEAINIQGDFNHLHNSFIDELAKRGMLGFLALMFLLGVPFHYFLKNMRYGDVRVVPFATAGVMLILSVVVFGFTQVFTAHNSGVMVFIFYLVIIKAYCRNILNIECVLDKNV